MNPNEGRPLAVVVDGTLTKGITANLDADCSVEDVRVGQFVKIHGEKYDFFCLVTDVMLNAANADVLANPPDPSDAFTRLVLQGTNLFGSVSLQPMLMLGKMPAAETDPSELGQALPVRTVPVHFAPVSLAGRADFDRVFAQPGDSSWQVGTPRDMDIPILLDLERVAERSNGVFGKSGSGKSMLTRLLLCGLIRSDRAVNLIFDMHSEYAWPKPDRGAVLRSLTDLFGRRVAVYTLKSNRPRPIGHKSDGDIAIGMNEITRDDVVLLSELLNLNETALETIHLLETEFREGWLLNLLEMDTPAIKDFADRAGAHPAAVGALKRKLSQLQRLDFVISEFRSPEASSISHIVRSLSSGRSVVLAFDQEGDLLQYMLVANIITRRIHDKWRTDSQLADAENRERPRQLVVTIEEAHKFLSPSAARHTSFGQIARELRKFNVTLLVVDQRPSGIDPEVLSQIGTRFSCQLNDENDIAAILAGVSGASHLRSVLASLDSQQEAILLGHAVPMPVVVKVRTIDEAFYADATASDKRMDLPTGRGLLDMATLPDD
ncbi:MAG TPA: ATP-binding protein [Chloroflexota bacterium]|nr:ATP-binding protein [Chloroflexota bacterium]